MCRQSVSSVWKLYRGYYYRGVSIEETGKVRQCTRTQGTDGPNVWEKEAQHSKIRPKQGDDVKGSEERNDSCIRVRRRRRKKERTTTTQEKRGKRKEVLLSYWDVCCINLDQTRPVYIYIYIKSRYAPVLLAPSPSTGPTLMILNGHFPSLFFLFFFLACSTLFLYIYAPHTHTYGAQGCIQHIHVSISSSHPSSSRGLKVQFAPTNSSICIHNWCRPNWISNWETDAEREIHVRALHTIHNSSSSSNYRFRAYYKSASLMYYLYLSSLLSI